MSRCPASRCRPYAPRTLARVATDTKWSSITSRPTTSARTSPLHDMVTRSESGSNPPVTGDAGPCTIAHWVRLSATESSKSVTPPDRFWLISMPGAMLATAGPGLVRGDPGTAQIRAHGHAELGLDPAPHDEVVERDLARGCNDPGLHDVPERLPIGTEVGAHRRRGQPIFQPPSRSPRASLLSRMSSCTRSASSNERRPTTSGGKYSPTPVACPDSNRPLP